MAAEGLSNLERYYNVVYDQSTSTPGNHLATCDSYGQISIFDLSAALGSTAGKKDRSPIRTVKGCSGALYSLKTVGPDLLVSGGEDYVKVWKWSNLVRTSEDVCPVAEYQQPYSKSSVPETNSLTYDPQREVLYCGCDDGVIYAWDINTGKLKASYSGHTDFVHCVCMRNGSSQFVSGAEDGTVRIWDPTAPKSQIQLLRPTKNGNGRHKGEWVGCVATDNAGDWLVCGGSMGPTFYHLMASSSTKTATMTMPDDAVTHSAIFVEDRVITAGSGGVLRHWSINGEALSCVPSEQVGHIFSCIYNTNSFRNQVLTVAGDSADISVFMNLGYAAFSLLVN